MIAPASFRNSIRALLMSSALLAVCACAPNDDASESDESNAQSAVADSRHDARTPMSDFPADARIVEIDDDTPFTEALRILQRSALDKLPNPPVTCLGTRYAIQSAVNGNFVSVELNNNNILRARATVIDEWEDFRVCHMNNDATEHPNRIVLWSVAAGKYVCPEFQYTGAVMGVLRARSATIPTDNDSWEIIQITEVPWGITLSMQNYGIYPRYTYKVSGEFAYSGDSYGMLRARQNGVWGEWERWNFVIH